MNAFMTIAHFNQRYPNVTEDAFFGNFVTCSVMEHRVLFYARL